MTTLITIGTSPSPDAQRELELEMALAAVDERLSALGEALRERDAGRIDLHASELHRTLASAVDQFARAARGGTLPPSLRRRLVRTSGAVAAQRESLARATAALDRAIDVLMPRDGGAVYSTFGTPERSAHSHTLQA
jgi:hypothetical protein